MGDGVTRTWNEPTTTLSQFTVPEVEQTEKHKENPQRTGTNLYTHNIKQKKREKKNALIYIFSNGASDAVPLLFRRGAWAMLASCPLSFAFLLSSFCLLYHRNPAMAEP